VITLHSLSESYGYWMKGEKCSPRNQVRSLSLRVLSCALSLVVGGSSGGRGTAIGEREIEIVSEIYAESEGSGRGGKRAEELTSDREVLRE